METRATGGGQQGTTSVEEGEREVQYPRIPSVSDSQPVGHHSFGGYVEQPFHRGYLRSSETIDIYITIHNGSKITAMK